MVGLSLEVNQRNVPIYLANRSKYLINSRFKAFFFPQ
uniref:Uncharacterized protein n=1 Tax=Anguilla anguilla TaxID=7936 RepID=A0A0E9QFG4_ANGAN